MKRVEISYAELYEFYVELNNTLDKTAEHFNCAVAIIKSYLGEYNITKGRNINLISIDKNDLYNYYIIKGFSKEKCAKFFNCSVAVITRRLRVFGIKKQIEHFTKDELYNEYIVNNHTVSECMDIFKCSRWAIENKTTKYGIYKPKENVRHPGPFFTIPFNDLYDYYIEKGNTKEQCADYFGCSETKIGCEIKRYNIVKKKSYKSINKDELYNFYIVENHSYKETAKHFATSIPSISRACRYYGITKDKSAVAILSGETKLKNHTYGKSKPEDDFYKYLCSKYGDDNVFRQYKDKRYPFFCDFYIENIDTFVELNLFWTHGPSPFDCNNSEHVKILKDWEIKAVDHPHYTQAIKTWTIRDKFKIATAKKNNLNYLIYYNKDNLYDGRV